MDGKIILGNQSLMIWAVILLLAGLLLSIWRSWAVRSDSSSRMIAPVLKSIGLLLLAICLLEPLKTGQRARPGANLFLVLADNSQSMSIKDGGDRLSRGERTRQLLKMDQDSWQVRLAQDFDVRRYQFDTRLQNVNDFSGLEFHGVASNLISILTGLKERFRGRPLAGVLLFTDGIATDVKSSDLELQNLPPIYPVIASQANHLNTQPDLRISHLATTTTAFEDAPVTIQADVRQTGLKNVRVTADVIDEEGTVVKKETQAFNDSMDLMPFRFQIRPTKPGISFYEVRVRIEDEARQRDEAKSNEESSVEVTLANNRRFVVIERRHDPSRILYLSGRPNWEYKFLKRAIDADDQVKLTGVIRVAKKEPKFDWRSREGENSNPLFRGFDGKTEETERYDQPVLVRLNTKNPEELRDGFPKTAAELFEFFAIIIDDLESEFFTPDQMTLLERFVTERGGGLLMLGGTESFQQGGYQKTVVGRMLPMYLESGSPATPSSGYRLNLTRDGWLQPWARLRSTETEEKQRLSEMPTFLTLNRSGRIKPGATVIADAIDSQGQIIPALAAQMFGRGRVAALLVGDLWRWQLNRTDVQRDKDDLGKAWRQTTRWLIADVPDRIELRSTAQPDQGQPLVRVEARIRNQEFQPQDNAAVQIEVELPGGAKVSQPAEPSLKEAGLYESTFAARQTGFYRAKVDVTDAEGHPIGSSVTGWTTDPAAEEFIQVLPNRELLARVANETGGEIVPAENLAEFVRSLQSRKAPLIESFTTPLWHQPVVLLLMIGCLLGEWGLRRSKGLP